MSPEGLIIGVKGVKLTLASLSNLSAITMSDGKVSLTPLKSAFSINSLTISAPSSS